MANSTLARLRRKAGYTQREFVRAFHDFAARLGVDATVSVRQLRRWENEAPPPLPHPNQQAVLEALFGIPLEEMGFDVPAHRRATSIPLGRTYDGLDVERRRFVADLGGLATAPAATRAGGGRIGAARIAEFRKEVVGLYRIDHTAGGTAARVAARTLIARIERDLTTRTYMERVGRQMQTVLGEVQCHLGWLAHDAGRPAEARAAVLEAMSAARLAGDAALEMRALSTLSLLAVDQGRPWEAASAVETAQRIAECRAGPTVRMVLALREARAVAAGGDLVASRRALSRAMTMYGQTALDDEPPRWVRFAGPVEIDYATGGHYVQVGQPSAAVPFLRAAVGGLTASYARNSALYRARLASVLFQSGEVDAACAEALAVIAHVGELGSARLNERLTMFARQVAEARTATARPAREYLERFRQMQEAQRG